MNTKAIIVNAATKLFYQLGYDKTTLRKIAEACGYSHTALFTYFKSKGEIASELQVNYLNALVAHTEDFLKSQVDGKKDPLMAFFYYWYLHFSLLKRDRHFANFYFEYYESENHQFVQIGLTKGKKITQDLFKAQLSKKEWQNLINYEMITAMDMILAKHYSGEKITIDHALNYLYDFFHANGYIKATDEKKEPAAYIASINPATLPTDAIIRELFY